MKSLKFCIIIKSDFTYQEISAQKPAGLDYGINVSLLLPCLILLLNLLFIFPRQLSYDFGSKDISLFSGSCLPISLTLIDGTYISFSFKQTNFVSAISWDVSWWQLFVYILLIGKKNKNTFSLIRSMFCCMALKYKTL